MIMAPPVMPEPTSLMRMHGERVGRGWMEIDPDLPEPSLSQILWLFVLIYGVVVFIGTMQP